MSVKTITSDALRRMEGCEGLILRGCGGSLEEWVDGINEMLTESGILLDGTRFQAENCSAFPYDGCTCLLFPFSEDVKLDVGRLAMWRLRTLQNFNGIWLSDFIPNHLGGFASEREQRKKPDCPLIGQDGNIFHLMSVASETLHENGMSAQAKEMCGRIWKSGSYGSALDIIGEYVNITSSEDMSEDCGEGMEVQL